MKRLYPYFIYIYKKKFSNQNLLLSHNYVPKIMLGMQMTTKCKFHNDNYILYVKISFLKKKIFINVVLLKNNV